MTPVKNLNNGNYQHYTKVLLSSDSGQMKYRSSYTCPNSIKLYFASRGKRRNSEQTPISNCIQSYVLLVKYKFDAKNEVLTIKLYQIKLYLDYFEVNLQNSR